MGAPAGNQNAAKAKKWAAAIERAVERLADPDIDPDVPVPRTAAMKGFDMLADAFVSSYMRDNPIAFYKEFGDRIDGKATVTIAGDADNPLGLQMIERRIVEPA